MSPSVVLLISLLAALLVPATWSAFRARRIIRRRDGTTGLEPSDLEKLFGPLVSTPLRRAGGRARLAERLRWARIGWAGPEVWAITTLLAGPLAFLLAFGLLTALGARGGQALILAGVAGAGGFMYPRTTLSRRLRARQRAIRRDVIPFIGMYARTATAVRDTTAVFERMLAVVEREAALRAGSDRPGSRARRHRRSPYESDLWVGLAEMMTSRGQNIHRRDATPDDPDALTRFAMWCNDPDLTSFIDRVRQARDVQQHITPEQLDIMVDNLMEQRQMETERSFATLAAKATVVLVSFNMPLLLLAIAVPLFWSIANSGF